MEAPPKVLHQEGTTALGGVPYLVLPSPSMCSAAISLSDFVNSLVPARLPEPDLT